MTDLIHLDAVDELMLDVRSKLDCLGKLASDRLEVRSMDDRLNMKTTLINVNFDNRLVHSVALGRRCG